MDQNRIELQRRTRAKVVLPLRAKTEWHKDFVLAK